MNGVTTHLKANVAPSPPSGNSSDTLHDNGSFDDDRKCSNISPLSTATLNFEDLKIHDDGLSYTHKDSDGFAGPFQGNFQRHHIPTPAYSPPVQQFRRNNHHFGPGNGFTRGGGNFRNTRTWVSEETRAAQEFLVVRNSMKRLFKNADVAKWKVADYIAHREAVMASKAKKLAEQAQDREAEIILRVPPISPQQQDMMRRCGLSGNFDQVGNYGRALGEKTIWCDDWQNGKDEIAPWPCLAEMKWEGDDRAKTGVGRYPPLPREQGPVGLPWNQLQAVEQYPLDQIARVPTMEDVYLPVDEINEEVKYGLLNKDLEDAMDAYLES
ncbi:hypothetical protein BU25DRAFT_348536 [Macroventuria anomochaeta]|uniref:Uncharacterized protein n=1 Tax=Macroventuria anomochaeta TaxID=301207 RepID=A0ACB6RTA0_9PLEO|nr:uncharacterized protein BU25DRAFT_348536 [Macroventuria anomochaeta]KAF2624159.1 hypothetical protein BU25DRAFT_348536 [Macroventuria anomochaeta]